MSPRFVVPPGALPSRYSMQAGSTSVWLMTMTENQRAKIALAEGAGLSVVPNDPRVVSKNLSVSSSAGLQIYELYGRMPGTVMLEAKRSDGAVAAHVQVRVDPLPKTGRNASWIRLAEPQVSLNAPNVKFMLRMKHSKAVPWDWSVDRMFDEAVPAGVRHLVFNCHGFPTGKKPDFPVAHLSIGTVIHAGNVGAFRKLFPIKELRVIWLAACNLADMGAGDELCAEMARKSGCYVVSAIYETSDIAIPSGHVEDYRYATPVYFQPGDGKKIYRGDFFEQGKALGFQIV